MDISHLQHDAQIVKANLRELDDGRLVTIHGCRIYCPMRFSERGLAMVGVETYICGIYAMVYQDKYATSLVNAMIRITPNTTNKVVVGGDEYYEFVFEPGSTVIASLDLVRSKMLVYKIYNEIISKARVPWYIDYKQMAHIFDTAKGYADAPIGMDHEITELIVSMIGRNPKDRTLYYRQSVQTPEQAQQMDPVFVPMRSVAYSATNTLNKMAGSFMNDGIVSALVSPATRVEGIEALLRQ